MRPAGHGRLAVGAAAVAGCALTVWLSYPGFVSPDSIFQLREARSFTFGGLHPPVMSLAWAATDRVLPGPAGLLLAHTLAYWAALCLLAWRFAPRRPVLALAILAVGLLPPSLALMGTIWKDSGLAATLGLGAALCVAAIDTGRRWLWIAALPALFYAAAVRHNALPAVVPIAYLWAVAASGGRGGPRAWGLAGVLVLAIALGTGALARVLVTPGAPFPAQTILLYDLAGMSVRSHQLILPAYLKPGVTLDAVSAAYAPWSVHPLTVSQPILLRLTSDAAEYASLKRTWWRNVRAHPGAYLRHRWDVFAMSLGLERPCYPFHPSPHAGVDTVTIASLGIAFAPSPARDLMLRLFEKVADGPWFRGWVWLVLAATVILVGAGSGLASRPTLAMASSALMYGLPFFLVGVGCDFRLQFWTFVAASISAVLLAGDVVSRRRPVAAVRTPAVQ